jgi:hypothetical protein
VQAIHLCFANGIFFVRFVWVSETHKHMRGLILAVACVAAVALVVHFGDGSAIDNAPLEKDLCQSRPLAQHAMKPDPFADTMPPVDTSTVSVLRVTTSDRAATKRIGAEGALANAADAVVDGDLATGIDVDGDIGARLPAWVAVKTTDPTPIGKVIVHFAKDLSHKFYRNVTVALYRGDALLWRSAGQYATYEGLALQGYPGTRTVYYGHEELEAVVPGEALHSDRVVVRCEVAWGQRLRLAEILLFRSATDTAPVRFMHHGNANPVSPNASASSVGVRGEACRHRPMLPIAETPPLPLVDVPARFDCAIIGALFGDVEKTAKRIVPQAHECVRLLFTNRNDLDTTSWRVINTSLPHLLHPDLKNTREPFLMAKFYKQQFHRFLPPHVKYAIWMDSTMEVTHAQFTTKVVEALRTRSSITARWSDFTEAFQEVVNSVYLYFFGRNRFDYMVATYLGFLREGYCEGWWTAAPQRPPTALLEQITAVSYMRNTCPARLHTYAATLPVAAAQVGAALGSPAAAACRPMGWGASPAELREALRGANETLPTIYNTAVVGIDLSKGFARRFLDDWWRSTYHHWQDQMTFPVLAWKYGIVPRTMNHPILDSATREQPHFEGMCRKLQHGL